MLKFFTKEIVKPFQVPEYVIFNVDNFNNWFNDTNNNAIYANPGIFLRTDKLSQSHVMDYLEKCYGLDCGVLIEDTIVWSNPINELILDFYHKIIIDWRMKNAAK